MALFCVLPPWLTDGVVDWVGDDVVEEDNHLGHRQADVHNHPAQKYINLIPRIPHQG